MESGGSASGFISCATNFSLDTWPMATTAAHVDKSSRGLADIKLVGELRRHPVCNALSVSDVI